MTTVTESDIKELKDLINNRFDTLFNEQTEIKSDIKEIKSDIKNLQQRSIAVETRIETWKPAIDKIPDLAEKFGELKNWRQISFVLITALVGALIGWVVRGGNLRP